MSKIIIGQDTSGHDLKMDVDLLIPSRLLVQANSGGGKSWLLRRLAEEFYRIKLQTIILDPEGEFFTLREKFGYVLVGEGGETPADVRSAAMLAEKFLQLKISAVCDLFEAFRSRPMDRRQWVRSFLNALLDAPRSLWHPLIVIVDEAHKFCPQETPKAASMTDREIIGGCKEAMIALSTTGRKRGYCPIWATQRLAKLDKDASAEFFNRLVGMTVEDVDIDRATDLMGVGKADKQDFRMSLRRLTPGQFYAFGRAICSERQLVKVGSVQTHHPETGVAARTSTPPPTPESVKALLPQLSDLPKQAEDRARTEADLRREVKELKHKLAQAHKENPAPTAPDPQQLERERQRAAKTATAPLIQELRKHAAAAAKVQRDLIGAIAVLDGLKGIGLIENVIPAVPDAPVNRAEVGVGLRWQPKIPPRTELPKPPAAQSNGNGELDKGGGERNVLIALAQYGELRKEQLTLLTGYKRSSRNEYLRRLSGRNYVIVSGEIARPTDAGVAALGSYKPLPAGRELYEFLKRKLDAGELKILQHLVDDLKGEPVPVDSLDENVGYKRSSRNEYLRRLKLRMVIEFPSQGMVQASPTLFD